MRRIGIALAVIGSIVVVQPTASAHRSRDETGITAAFTDNEPSIPIVQPDPPDTFSGGLSSERAECLKGRTVAIYKAGAPNSSAHAISDEEGNWTVNEEDPPSGNYFAFAEPKRVTRGKHRHICMSARSGNMAV